VEIRIGIVQSMKELEVEIADDVNKDAVIARVESSLATERTLSLTDRRGRRIIVPVDRVAYVEFGVPASERRVGFGAA
jgi:hypothetical protein